MSQRERMRQRQIVQSTDESALAAKRLQPNIDLQIDQLIVDGVRASDRDQLGDALQNELAALLLAQGLSRNLYADVALPHLPSQVVTINPSMSPSLAGRRIAQSLYRSMTHIPSTKRTSAISTTTARLGGATK
jgi:hypothetical protein